MVLYAHVQYINPAHGMGDIELARISHSELSCASAEEYLHKRAN